MLFDGIDLSAARHSGKRNYLICFEGPTFGGIRVKNYKTALYRQDTWLGRGQNLKIPAVYDLWWDTQASNTTCIQRRGLDPLRFQIVARPIFGSGQWLDRSLYHPVQTKFWDERTRTSPISRSAPAPTRTSRRSTVGRPAGA